MNHENLGKFAISAFKHSRHFQCQRYRHPHSLLRCFLRNISFGKQKCLCFRDFDKKKVFLVDVADALYPNVSLNRSLWRLAGFPTPCSFRIFLLYVNFLRQF